jgi:hypothetical protein
MVYRLQASRRNQGVPMKSFALALALLSGAATAAIAQDATPDL